MKRIQHPPYPDLENRGWIAPFREYLYATDVHPPVTTNSFKLSFEIDDSHNYSNVFDNLVNTSKYWINNKLTPAHQYYRHLVCDNNLEVTPIRNCWISKYSIEKRTITCSYNQNDNEWEIGLFRLIGLITAFFDHAGMNVFLSSRPLDNYIPIGPYLLIRIEEAENFTGKWRKWYALQVNMHMNKFFLSKGINNEKIDTIFQLTHMILSGAFVESCCTPILENIADEVHQYRGNNELYELNCILENLIRNGNRLCFEDEGFLLTDNLS